MIVISKLLAALVGLSSLATATIAHADTPIAAVDSDAVIVNHREYNVVGVHIVGVTRTNVDWLISYLDLQFPSLIKASDVGDLERKIMTTGVFTSVSVTLVPVPGRSDEFKLQVDIEERWTLIPVIRGAYGGGIPLRVLGFYDVHLLGRLLTVGAESRSYGSAPPGFVVYGRNPRAHADRYYLGEEFWRDFRRRQIFDTDGRQIGELSSNIAMNRIRILAALDEGRGAELHPWRIGGDLEVVQENPSEFRALPDAPSSVQPEDLHIRRTERMIVKVLPTLFYNDILVDQIHYQGNRFRLRLGPVMTRDKCAGFAEVEAFHYSMLGAKWNAATRAVIGATTINSLQSQYFLGGLDTVRGLPDSALYSTHAAYANLELRHLELKSKSLWVQTAAFIDAGEAGASWAKASVNSRMAAGIGVRLSVPQVYRLMLRIDYAWSVVGPRTQGITLGLNQFFDPITPL